MKKLAALVITAVLLGLQGLAFGQVGSFPALIGQRGTTLPVNCSVGQLFFKTNAPAGSQIYGCSATNTWVLEGNGSLSLTSAHLLVGNGANIATDVALSGDCSMANTGAITCTKTSGASWLVKTTTYTAANADRIVADSTGGAFTITLPASPTTGQNVQFKSGPTADTNNVTLARNGSTIMGAASNLLLDVANIDITLVYDGSTWRF